MENHNLCTLLVELKTKKKKLSNSFVVQIKDLDEKTLKFTNQLTKDHENFLREKKFLSNKI